MKKIACIFPGIGYTCDKPLLYYSAKLLRGMDWQVVPVAYSGFPDRVKGNQEKTQQTVQMALEQAEEMLREIDWEEYGEILLIGKSLGTIVCAAYAKRYGLRCRQILFTPVEETFRFAARKSVAFHGTADSWVDTEMVEECCRIMDIPLHIIKDANHSLETGDVDQDIKELRKIMKTVRDYAGQDA